MKSPEPVINSLAIFGGTFDPVHIGHLRSAIEVRELLACDELRFIPCHQPPHRTQPAASSAQRLRMLELAIADEPRLAVDAREIQRNGPSYTIDTLMQLRAEVGAQCRLYLIIGMDAFAALDSWHRWRELLDFAHIVVMQRPQNSMLSRGVVAELLRERRVDVEQLQTTAHGSIAIVQLTPLPISATAIRALIRERRSPRYLLPDAVWEFIRENGLYL
ncbi:MAG: nicotinate-nucleotide adenylyltransferase [Spongiibacteraceae bacterium]